MIHALLDSTPMTDAENDMFFDKIDRLKIATMTPATWRKTTGKSDADLVSFIKSNCRIHDIRKFLTGEEQLGQSPKVLMIDSPVGTSFVLTSLKPQFRGFNTLAKDCAGKDEYESTRVSKKTF
jgi:hypothetical protein